MRIKPSRILFAGLGAGVLALWVALELPCVIRCVTGIPCPMCGMSRAWLAFLRLDLGAAFTYHGMFWCVPLFFLLYVTDGKLFGQSKAARIITQGLVGIFLLYYIIRLVLFFAGRLPV